MNLEYDKCHALESEDGKYIYTVCKQKFPYTSLNPEDAQNTAVWEKKELELINCPDCLFRVLREHEGKVLSTTLSTTALDRLSLIKDLILLYTEDNNDEAS